MLLRKFRSLLFASSLLTIAQVAIVPPKPAVAGPLIAGVVGLLGLTGIGATVATAVIGVGLSVGLNYAISALTPKPAPPQGGTELDTRYGGAVPRSSVAGEDSVGGQLIYANTYGAENKLMQVVYVIGDGLHDSLQSMWFNGKEYTFAAEGPSPAIGGRTLVSAEGGAAGGGSPDSTPLPKVWVRFFNGTYDQAADPELVNHANPAGRWTANHRGRGICYVSMTIEYDEDLGIVGYPEVRFKIRGLRCYDARFDDENGGDGDQRWTEQDTYVWQDNPAVLSNMYRRGIFIGQHCVVGMGVAPADLIQSMYTVAANDCDDDVPLKEGGTEPRYRVATSLSNDRDHAGNLSALRDAMAGYDFEVPGSGFGIIAGVAQAVATDLEFTDDDLEVGESHSFVKYRPYGEIATAMYGQFRDPAQKYEAVAFPARESAYDDAIMGGQIQGDIDLTQITSSSQAQRVAEIRRRASLLGRGQCVLGPRWYGAWPGDWITFNSARHGSMTVLVTKVSYRADMKVAISYDQITTNVFGWTTAGEQDPPSISDPGDRGGIITNVAGMAAIGVNVPGAGSGPTQLVRPGIQFTWTTPNDPSVDTIIWEIRKNGETASFQVQTLVPQSGSRLVTEGLQAGTEYQYRYKITTTPVRDTSFSSYATVTAGGSHVVPSVLTSGLIGQIVEAQLADAAVTGAKIAAAAISATKIAAGLQLVGTGTSNPDPGSYPDSALFFNSTDGKLYRKVGGSWTPAVATTDLTGTVVEAQIANAAVTATKLAAQAVELTKFATGLQPVEVLGTLPVSGNIEGRTVYLTTDNKIYRYDGSNFIVTTDGADIVAGSITGGKIQAGAISTTQLAAGAVTTTILAAGAITADKIATGAGGHSNLFYNSDFKGSITNQIIFGNDGGASTPTGINAVTAYGANWHPTGLGVLIVSGTAATSGSRYVLISHPNSLSTGTFGRLTVNEGQQYEFSAYVAMNSVTGAFVRLIFFDSGGAVLSDLSGNVQTGNASGPLSSWVRSVIRATAPSGAVSCETRIQYTTDAVAAWNLVVAAPFFGAAVPGSADGTFPAVLLSGFARWTPSGSVLIEGGRIVANSIITGHMAANSISGDRITAGTLDAAKITANSITAGQIQAGAIGATEIAANGVRAQHVLAGEIAASKLAIGGGGHKNLFHNADFKAPIAGMHDFGVDVGSAAAATVVQWAEGTAGFNWTPPGMGAATWSDPGSPTAEAWVGFYTPQEAGGYGRFAVRESTEYEFSAYFGLHRVQDGTAHVRILWFNSGGSHFSTSTGNLIANGNGQAAGPLTNWPRSAVRATSPSGAVTAVLRVQFGVNGQANPFVFIAAPFFGAANSVSTEFATWTPSTTTLIDGGRIITNAITAAKILAGAVTAGKINAGAIDAQNLFVDNVIIRGRLVVGAATKRAIATPANISNSNTNQVIVSTTMTPPDGAVDMRLQVGRINQSANPATGFITALNFRVDGVTVKTFNIRWLAASGGGEFIDNAHNFTWPVTGLSNASHTFDVQHGGTPHQENFSDIMLIVDELAR